MRFLVLAALAVLPTTSTAAEPGQQPARPKAIEDMGPWRSDCPPTAAQQVAKQIRQGKPPMFHRLDKLPPATAYTAVLRQVNGCEAPLTIIEYRRNAR